MHNFGGKFGSATLFPDIPTAAERSRGAAVPYGWSCTVTWCSENCSSSSSSNVVNESLVVCELCVGGGRGSRSHGYLITSSHEAAAAGHSWELTDTEALEVSAETLTRTIATTYTHFPDTLTNLFTSILTPRIFVVDGRWCGTHLRHLEDSTTAFGRPLRGVWCIVSATINWINQSTSFRSGPTVPIPRHRRYGRISCLVAVCSQITDV